jgi:hypothetical protein
MQELARKIISFKQQYALCICEAFETAVEDRAFFMKVWSWHTLNAA